jgi:hypothetical protein
LLYENALDLEPEPILARAAILAATPTELAGDGTGWAIAFPHNPIRFREGEVSYAVWFLLSEGGLGVDPVEAAMAQTWFWPGARDVVRSGLVEILVVDLMSGPLDPRQRLPLFHSALAAAVELTKPVALRFVVAECFVDPTAYLADRIGDPVAFRSTVNVRLFDPAGRPGEHIMDTLGMASFGLPDVQMHYTGLDSAWVASRILGTARYLFDRGDVIADANTVPGLTEAQRWRCAHEVSLAPPAREVLDIHPAGYAPKR